MPPLPTVRAASVADIPAAAVVRASAVTDVIVSADGMLTWLSAIPEAAQLLLLAAEVDDDLVGWCTASRNWFGVEADVGLLDVVVRADHQGRGLGSDLARRALAHLEGLGITKVLASSATGAAQEAMARRFGFVEAHGQNGSTVDPRTVEAEPVPPDVTLRAFGEIDDPRPLYELDLEVSRDIPGDENFDGMSLESWTTSFWHTVFADDEASFAAYVDGELAGMTMLRVDRPSGRAQNNLTGVRGGFRGRGLARLLKSHSLHQAGLAGATVAFTFNDETNAAMLAVNHSLGYRHSSRWIEWERLAAQP